MRAIAISKKTSFLVALIICLGNCFPARAFTGLNDTLLTKEAVGALNMPEIIAPVKAPFPMPQFKKPSFNALSINISKKGAKPGTLVTRAIQSAIDEVNRRGGGTVVVPPGIWNTGRIILKSNVNLHIPEGAVLRFSGDINDYLPVVFTRSAGVEVMSLGACIYANGQQNIAVTGKGKLIGPADGTVRKQQIGYGSFENEFPFDKPVPARIYDGKNDSKIFSPTFIGPINCKDVYIEGISLEQTAFWNIVPTYCDGVIIRGVTVNSIGTPMGDGMDIESCRNVLIEYCTLSTGDDCYTIKAGRGVDGLRVNKPCENIVVRYSLAKEGHGGITCGSETAGMIRNLYVHDCVFDGTNIGIRFKTRRPRGGGGENLYYERIRMNLKGAAFRVDMLGSSEYVGELAGRDKRPVNELTPLYRNIVAKEIIVEQADDFLKISGLPESLLTNFLIENADVSSKKLISISDASGVTLKNVRVRSTESLIQIIDAKNINFEKVQFNVPVNEVAAKNESN